MFVRSDEYDPGVDSQYADKLTSLIAREERIFAGREDGAVECVRGCTRYVQPVFKREFDSLENDIIREQVIALEVTTDGGVADILFAGNEKSITVLRLRNDQPTLSTCRSDPAPGVRVVEEIKCPNVHNYVTNSIVLSAGGSALLSADFLRINLWSPARMDKYFTVLDLKPQTGCSGISSVINMAKFSPFSDGLFAWAASNGEVHLTDLSIRPAGQQAATLGPPPTASLKSVSDVAFVDENLVVSRSLNSVFLSDTRRPREPVFSTELVTSAAELEQLNSSEAIYQTFKIAADGVRVYTGSCFGTVFVLDLLTLDHEEVLVAPARAFSVEKRIRHVVHDGTGFMCAYNGKLQRYESK